MLSVTAQSTAPQYDGRGNMTRDHQGQTYEYDHYNRLSGVGTSIDLAYDPAGRLQETSTAGPVIREMQYDGLDLIAEYSNTGTLTARYVHGPGADEPLVQYAGASVSTRQWLLADERGSIVAVTDWSGAAIQINSYDEYGAPAPGNAGRFGYTGQVWLPETGLYHYKNRAYNPELGRFMQTDPIGVNGGMNLYAYVGGDPVNLVDPLGLWRCYEFISYISVPNPGVGVTGHQVRNTFCIDTPDPAIGDMGPGTQGGATGSIGLGSSDGNGLNEVGCEQVVNEMGAAPPRDPSRDYEPGRISGDALTAGGHLAAGGGATFGYWVHEPSGRFGAYRTVFGGGGVSLGAGGEHFEMNDMIPEGLQGTSVVLSAALWASGSAIASRQGRSPFNNSPDRMRLRGYSLGAETGMKFGLSLNVSHTEIFECTNPGG